MLIETNHKEKKINVNSQFIIVEYLKVDCTIYIENNMKILQVFITSLLHILI